ncbi:MAG: hypothetical protein ACON4R_08785 [Akkermansiaceae bacterium]
MDQPGQVVEKQKEDGTLFRCEAVHFEGEGLIDVLRKAADDGGDYSVQFSLNGEPLGIVLVEGRRERLFYERDMGYGEPQKAACVAHALLTDLRRITTEEEIKTYHL